jgi:hypothetical protein
MLAISKVGDIINSVKLRFLGSAEPVHVAAQMFSVWMINNKL